ncbi:hypothetical protein WCLP8_1180001 [uncultured Gammaproteobacteria bacterium]
MTKGRAIIVISLSLIKMKEGVRGIHSPGGFGRQPKGELPKGELPKGQLNDIALPTVTLRHR